MKTITTEAIAEAKALRMFLLGHEVEYMEINWDMTSGVDPWVRTIIKRKLSPAREKWVLNTNKQLARMRMRSGDLGGNSEPIKSLQAQVENTVNVSPEEMGYTENELSDKILRVVEKLGGVVTPHDRDVSGRCTWDLETNYMTVTSGYVRRGQDNSGTMTDVFSAISRGTRSVPTTMQEPLVYK